MKVGFLQVRIQTVLY